MKIRRRPDPQKFLARARARGWRPHSSKSALGELVRDAAHEAFHALTVQLEEWGDREAIHAELIAHLSPPALWVHEIEARLVEREVCRILGVDSGRTLEDWIALSCMEAVRTRVHHTDPEKSMVIADRFPSHLVRLGAHRVIAFAPFPDDRLSW